MGDEDPHRDDLTRIESKVSSLIAANLQRDSKYLFSQLGKDLGEDLKLLKVTQGIKLIDFVRARFSDQYQVVATGKNMNIFAIMSKSIGSELPVLPEPRERVRVPRFNRRLWGAFAVPSTGQPRFLDLESLMFRDGEPSENANEREIPLDLIPAADVQNRDAVIAENVKNWLSANALPLEDFLANEFEPESRREFPTAARLGRSVLELLLETLDHRQLQSTNITLDVAAALHRKRV